MLDVLSMGVLGASGAQGLGDLGLSGLVAKMVIEGQGAIWSVLQIDSVVSWRVGRWVSWCRFACICVGDLLEFGSC